MLQGVLNELLSVDNSDLDSETAAQQALSSEDWLLRKITLSQVPGFLQHVCCIHSVVLSSLCCTVEFICPPQMLICTFFLLHYNVEYSTFLPADY